MKGGMEGWREGWRDGGMEGWREGGVYSKGQKQPVLAGVKPRPPGLTTKRYSAHMPVVKYLGLELC